MFEKLMLAAAMTLLLNFFLGVSSQQTKGELLFGKNASLTVSLLNSSPGMDIPQVDSQATSLD
ncbi:MAG TPA: hypothetical protein V6D28_17915 [Leptolyngbyaceae cyanobacterium]